MEDAELNEEVRERMRALGFAKVGVARAEALEPEGEQLRAWIAEGRHGQMDWMAQTADVRADPRHPGMVEGALSVVIGAFPYARSAERVGPDPGRVARYARGRDYHNVLSKRLRKVVSWLRELGHEARFSVDSRPLFERAWAERAGLGFIGKNCCLIVPGLGSHVFLGAVVTTARLTPDAPMKRRCGDCRLCLDACPTDAFVGERELDARRCISYLTIEHEGPIEPELADRMGDWLFGCDVCQDVCPYNRTALPDPAATEPFAPHARFEGTDCEDLIAMDEESYRTWSEGSPMRRPGQARIARNARIVLANGKRALPLVD
ncbi:MAG: tRNA epoxyqueuosine(34) reductase QueG [Deltaproteobacteria bacterium]|nr:tRNA epoxyqueuosine(34) reductase QueG [Deltaproteobacteria bacterium]